MKKSDGAGMKIQFIGTGAADFDWSEYGKPGVLGSTSTLLDDHVLIDCGPTVPAALARFNADAAEITDIVITHNHSDHFDMESVKKIAGNGKIRLFGSPQVCAEAEVCCEVHPVSYGCRFQVAGFDFLALPANHAVEDPYEDTFLYVISGGGRTLLYALDTAWFSSRAKRFLGTSYLDGIIWDATMSEAGDWRVFDHSDPTMFRVIRKTLAQSRNIDEKTRIWFNHRARTLWPADPAEEEKIAVRENVELAHEGEIVIF